MTPAEFTFDYDQVKTRSKAQIVKSIFLHKKHILDSEFLQDFKYVISFLLRFVELPNIGSKIVDMLFAVYCYENAKNIYLENACSYSQCSSLIYEYCTLLTFTKFWVL